MCLAAASNCRHIISTKSRENVFHYRKKKIKSFSVPESENTMLHFNNFSNGGGELLQYIREDGNSNLPEGCECVPAFLNFRELREHLYPERQRADHVGTVP